jgi:hypothetical protein
VRLEVYGRLLASREYAAAAAEFLMAHKTAQAVAEVAKAARNSDLRFILPLVASVVEQAAPVLTAKVPGNAQIVPGHCCRVTRESGETANVNEVVPIDSCDGQRPESRSMSHSDLSYSH